MSSNPIKRFIIVLISFAIVVQPLAYSYGQASTDTLAPGPAFSKSHMTAEKDIFSRSLLTDMEFFSFALFVYKSVILEGKDIANLLERLQGLPFWSEFKARQYLAKDFVSVQGDTLTIKLNDGDAIRVFPSDSQQINEKGAAADGITPEYFAATDNFVLQYIKGAPQRAVPEAAPSDQPEIAGIYLDIWEKARPYYEKGRSFDIQHVRWMMKQAARIAAVTGLDGRVLIPLVILHDVGYAACLVDEKTHSFDKEVKRKHMEEGAKIARTVLEEAGYDPALTEKIVRYVSVHDNWRFGDDSPFKESREMAVFQDLDFTFMATPDGFETARTVVFHKSPREMYEFLMHDEKLTKRPFATGETSRLFRSLMEERRKQVEASEKEEENGRGEDGQAMIGFGPGLSYTALKMSPEFDGIYITATGSEIACRTEEGASEKARHIAEMLNQVLEVLNLQLTMGRDDRGSLTRYVAGLLDEMKYRIGVRKIEVKAASNLQANSARYLDKLVFNEAFISTIYDMWHANRLETTPDSWAEEVGAIWMMAERLFHELDHDADEVEQIFKDVLFYKAVLKGRGFISKAIKFDASMEIKINGSGKTAVFGEFFGSNQYFAMIHRLSEMSDRQAVYAEIKRYLEETYRHNSSRGSLGLSDGKIRYAEAMLGARGIVDDIFGEKIFGMDLGDFFREHCLFTFTPPYEDQYVEKDRKLWVSDMYRRRVDDIQRKILSIGANIGQQAETQRWMDNALKSDKIRGKGSTKRKLYPLLLWASRVVYPQNYELRTGKLFGSTYYEGLNLMTIPIFPLGEDGKINWGLMSWMNASGRAPLSERAPPDAYFRAQKISLYEYLITRDVPESGSTAAADNGREEYIQLSLFDDPVTYDAKPGSEAVVKATGEYEETAEENISTVHSLTMSIDVSGTVDKVTHILVESDIPAPSQQQIITFFNKRSREAMASEKICFMSAEEINAYIASNKCSRENTVVLVSDVSKIGAVKSDVNMLVVRKEGVADFVNIEGLLGAARCVLNKDWDAFRDIFSALTGSRCPEIRPEWLADPVELAKHLIITLPPVSIINVNDQKKLNEMLMEALVAA